MFDKIESAMKNGSILFINQCEEAIYNTLENLVNEKFTYNAEKGKNCYLIKNRKMVKSEKFKLYLIKSKPSSKISPKAFANCYVINFTCPADVISDSIYDSLCKEQNLNSFLQKNKINNVINKDLFKLMEIEKKLLTYNKQFDFSGNLEKLDHNQNVLDKYKIETSTHTTISKQINNNKKRIEIFNIELDKFKIISKVCSKIYKLLMKFFYYDNLYILPIEYISDLVKEFYRNNYGIYSKEIKKKIYQKKNKDKNNEENEEEEKEEEEVPPPQPEQGAPSNNNNPQNPTEEADKEEKEEEKELEKELKRQKELDEIYPCYHEENSFDLVVFIYNKISHIYDVNKRRHLLLILLLYGMKFKEEIPSNCKQIIYNTFNYNFRNNEEISENLIKSPVSKIDDRTWTALKQINDNSSYIFSIIIDHIESHPQEWETFLDKDEILLERDFEVVDEELASTINPFNKFLFFSIVKPNLSDSLINCVLKDIIKTQEVSYIDDNGETKYRKYTIEENKNIEELFFENMAQTKKPILIFDNGNGEILYYHEILDFYMPKLKEIIAEKNAKAESPVNEVISLKEIVPSKLELTNVELDTIHSAMKNGGVIFVRNCYMVKESLLKIMDEIKEENASINESFKLILLMNNKYLIPDYFYSNCNIINRDLTILTEMKEFIIDLISSTPVNLFNRFMNCESNNSSSYYIKKLYIYFTMVIVILVQYSNIKSKMFKIPIGFQRKDYFSILAYIYKYMNSISEDKQKELSNPDNFYGFTYESLIKIISDVFISARMITKEEFENMNDFLLQIYENSFFLKEDSLFAYDEFILMNIDEKKYPLDPLSISEELEKISNKNLSSTMKNVVINRYMIPKSALIEEFDNIPNESYFCLMYGISNQMLEQKKQVYIKQFFDIICINNVLIKNENNGKEKKEENAINNLKINIKTIAERLNDLKHNLPDLLNTTEANQVLFKINKYNELFNPLDECLQVEIDSFNNYINRIETDINCLLSVIKGDMVLIDKYRNMLNYINKNIIPREWHLSKYPPENKEIKIDDWVKRITKIYEFFNNWIYEGYSRVYNLSYFNNERLFLTLLPVYFQKKLPEGKISSDKIKLHYKLTKYDNEEDVTEEVMYEFKKNNNDNDFIFIKGLKLKGFETHKEEDREIKTFRESVNNKDRNELLPIVVITYMVEDYQYEVANQKEEEETEEEDEDEEEIQMNEEVQEENKNENPQPSGSGPKDDEENEEEKEKKDEGGEENPNEEGNKRENDIDKKEGDNKKEEPKDDDKKNEEQGEKEIKEEEKKEDNNVEVNKKVVVEETTVKTKKMEFMEVMSHMKNKNSNKEIREMHQGRGHTKIIRTKVRYYKKHCRLEIPFIEEQDPNTYNINEPYGFIELRLDCDKDKQEEYFQNKGLVIELDK